MISHCISLHLDQYLGILSMIVVFIGMMPYVKSVIVGKTKPHVISWFIWSVSSLVIFSAQITHNGGPGVWYSGVSGTVAFFIFILSLFKESADYNIKPVDWSCLFVAFIAIILWILISHPMWSVILLTFVNAIGMIPTFRKSYHKPFEEKTWIFFISTINKFISISAITEYSVTNTVFIIVSGVFNIILISMILSRRYILQQCKKYL